MIARLRRWWWRAFYRDKHCSLCTKRLAVVRAWTRFGPLCMKCSNATNRNVQFHNAEGDE